MRETSTLFLVLHPQPGIYVQLLLIQFPFGGQLRVVVRVADAKDDVATVASEKICTIARACPAVTKQEASTHLLSFCRIVSRVVVESHAQKNLPENI